MNKIIIIDGLDECECFAHQTQMIKLLSELVMIQPGLA
jgi:hypothetical protein